MQTNSDKPAAPAEANDSRTASDKAVVCKELLACVEPDITPIRNQLMALSQKYREGGEDRIGWEILQSIRALDEATGLALVYLSGAPLPTLAEIRGIYKQANADLRQDAGNDHANVK